VKAALDGFRPEGWINLDYQGLALNPALVPLVRQLSIDHARGYPTTDGFDSFMMGFK
jgi:hypothetical protein